MTPNTVSFRAEIAALAGATSKGVPMISVPDIAATLEWYTSLGFTEVARYQEDGIVNFGMLSFGKAELMLRAEAWGTGGRYQAPGELRPHDVSLWFYTGQVDRLYQLLQSRQLEFVEDLYEPFYGGRQFSVRDLNGYTLVFLQDA